MPGLFLNVSCALNNLLLITTLEADTIVRSILQSEQLKLGD